MKTENWIHGWLKSIWKKKDKHTFTSDVITFNKEGVVHEKHPFKSREFDGAFKECGCLPDCGCKETKKDNLKGWLP